MPAKSPKPSWAQALVWVGKQASAAWNRLEKAERQELFGLIQKSKGRLSNLANHERMTLANLVNKARGPR